MRYSQPSNRITEQAVLQINGLRPEWHYLNEKSAFYVVIPAKAGIQWLKNIGR